VGDLFDTGYAGDEGVTTKDREAVKEFQSGRVEQKKTASKDRATQTQEYRLKSILRKPKARATAAGGAPGGEFCWQHNEKEEGFLTARTPFGMTT
jgi:hypothetical protein